MDLTYFKRYRMEIDLLGQDFSDVELPPGYRFQAWDESLLEAFARAKYESFREEIDANVFPCLGELAGCRRLMSQITAKSGFIPEATWLITYAVPDQAEPEYCGTIQGIRSQDGLGAIQNIGITPGHRSLGLGTRLLFRALEGFRRAGLERVYLEVTAQNDGAVRLYRRLGFSTAKTVFKAAEVAYS
ncbi:MAG TPA: GNAT family N-acetyltransferase [Thermoguttaceae bacterium]|nr:GNAT family N-acetyltransferase [Thermoguttaceae bacterium]